MAEEGLAIHQLYQGYERRDQRLSGKKSVLLNGTTAKPKTKGSLEAN